MATTEKETSMLALLCAGVSGPKPAHQILVGLLPVRDEQVCIGFDLAAGGALNARPRTTETPNFVQRPLGGYGRPQGVNTTSVSIAQGSQMASPLAPASTKASGVPPRGRPV